MADDEWRVATGGRRHRKAGRGAAPAPGPHHGSAAPATDYSSSSKPPTERQVQQRCAAVDAAAREVAAAPLWRHLLQQLGALPPHCALPAIRRMVVYGLGSLEQPGAVHIRYQLALATLLAAALPNAAAPPAAFDPVFTPLDRAVLKHFSIEVLPHDEGGRHVAEQPTLFWMPHCEAVLTDALLAANAAAGTLHNVVVLGNRFSGYRDSWALRQRAHQPSVSSTSGEDGGRSSERPDTMLRLCACGAVQELRIGECGFPVASAFNDLGVHTFVDWRPRFEASAAGVTDNSLLGYRVQLSRVRKESGQ